MRCAGPGCCLGGPRGHRRRGGDGSCLPLGPVGPIPGAFTSRHPLAGKLKWGGTRCRLATGVGLMGGLGSGVLLGLPREQEGASLGLATTAKICLPTPARLAAP